MPSILDPLTCGFAKVRCYCIFTCNNSIKCVDGAIAGKEIYKFFQCIVKNLQKLGKRNKTGKFDAMQFFSLQNWKALTAEEKKQHSLFNCQEALKIWFTNPNWLCLKTSPIHSREKLLKLDFIKLLMRLQLPKTLSKNWINLSKVSTNKHLVLLFPLHGT